MKMILNGLLLCAISKSHRPKTWYNSIHKILSVKQAMLCVKLVRNKLCSSVGLYITIRTCCMIQKHVPKKIWRLLQNKSNKLQVTMQQNVHLA